MTNKNNIDSFEVALGKFKIKAQGENVPQLIHDIFSKNIGVWALGAGAITVAIGIAKLIIKDIDKGTKWLFDPIIEKPTPAPIQPSTADTSASIQDVAAEESIPMPTTESMADLIRKDVEMPERLIGDLLCSEDICILLGGTGQMKSILAMQMAIEISCGFESPLVPEDEEIKPQKVIYFDGELKDSDIKERYGKTDSAFLNNIDRITDCWEFSPDQLLNVVETYVLKVSGDCTVIFDNYYSLFKNATEKQLVNIREKLKSIQKKALGRVTFIIVVHTTKNGDKKSLDVNDIYGSSYFRNLASIIIGINQTDCNKNHKSLTILKTTGNRSLHE